MCIPAVHFWYIYAKVWYTCWSAILFFFSPPSFEVHLVPPIFVTYNCCARFCVRWHSQFLNILGCLYIFISAILPLFPILKHQSPQRISHHRDSLTCAFDCYYLVIQTFLFIEEIFMLQSLAMTYIRVRVLVKYQNSSIFPRPASEYFSHIPSYFHHPPHLFYSQSPATFSATQSAKRSHRFCIHLERSSTLSAPRLEYLGLFYLMCTHDLHKHSLT